MQTIGTDYEDILNNIVPVVVKFGEEAEALKLKLSPKGVITASNPKLAALLRTKRVGF